MTKTFTITLERLPDARTDDTAGYSVPDAPERGRKAGGRVDAVHFRVVLLPFSFGTKATPASQADVGGFMMNSKYANGDVGKGTPGGGGGPGNTWGDLAAFGTFQKGFAEFAIYLQTMEWV
jgi:hypothetical protein